MNDVIETRGLGKSFGRVHAVVDANLTVPSGSIYGLVGANGAGKSTLLRLVVGRFQPSSGEVYVLGENLSAISPKLLYERLHYIAGDIGAYPDLRVAEMLNVARLMYRKWDKTREAQLLEAFSLPTKQRIRHLSKGKQMQLRFVIGLSARPEILVLDEATNGLDPVVKQQLLHLVLEAAGADEMTVLFATQQLEEIERMADHVAVMANGRIISAQTLDSLQERIHEVCCVLDRPVSAQLLQHPNVLRIWRQGAYLSLVVDGDVDVWKHRLTSVNAEYIDVHSLDLYELFHIMMEEEGYRRDRVHFS